MGSLTKFMVVGAAAGVAQFGLAATYIQIDNIYSTGYNTSGNKLSAAGTDPHYQYAAQPESSDGTFAQWNSYWASPHDNTSGTSPLYVTSGWPNIATSRGSTPWGGNYGLTSQWISPTATGNQSGYDSQGFYYYHTTFTLTGKILDSSFNTISAKLDPTTAYISGQAAVDNALVDIYLNGHKINKPSGADFWSTGVDQAASSNSPGAKQVWTQQHSQDHYFYIPAGSSLFNEDGTNDLTFVVYNYPGKTGNPSGLNVMIYQAAATVDAAQHWEGPGANPYIDPVPAGYVPEPTTILSLALTPSLGLLVRRRARKH